MTTAPVFLVVIFLGGAAVEIPVLSMAICDQSGKKIYQESRIHPVKSKVIRYFCVETGFSYAQ